MNKNNPLSIYYLKPFNKHSMTKKKKLELEIMAVQLWFRTFGPRNMSSEAEQLHMSVVLNKLKDKLSKCNMKKKSVDLYPGNMGDEMSAPTSI